MSAPHLFSSANEYAYLRKGFFATLMDEKESGIERLASQFAIHRVIGESGFGEGKGRDGFRAATNTFNLNV